MELQNYTLYVIIRLTQMSSVVNRCMLLSYTRRPHQASFQHDSTKIAADRPPLSSPPSSLRRRSLPVSSPAPAVAVVVVDAVGCLVTVTVRGGGGGGGGTTQSDGMQTWARPLGR